MTPRPDHIAPPADYALTNLYDELERSGFRPRFGYAVAAFITDVRANPHLALICAAVGAVAGMLAVLVPAIVIAGVVR